MTNTATFQDTYGAPKEMVLETFKIVVRGAKVIRFRWIKADKDAPGCVTTGFIASGFKSADAAVAAAKSHALFSNVI